MSIKLTDFKHPWSLYSNTTFSWFRYCSKYFCPDDSTFESCIKNGLKACHRSFADVILLQVDEVNSGCRCSLITECHRVCLWSKADLAKRYLAAANGDFEYNCGTIDRRGVKNNVESAACEKKTGYICELRPDENGDPPAQCKVSLRHLMGSFEAAELARWCCMDVASESPPCLWFALHLFLPPENEDIGHNPLSTKWIEASSTIKFLSTWLLLISTPQQATHRGTVALFKVWRELANSTNCLSQYMHM